MENGANPNPDPNANNTQANTNPETTNTATPAQNSQPTQPQPAPAKNVESMDVELPRYPMLQGMVGALRILAILFLLLAAIFALLSFFDPNATFIEQIGRFMLFVLIGLFQGVMCFTLAEGLKALVDIEKQTRTPEMESELHKTVSVS